MKYSCKIWLKLILISTFKINFMFVSTQISLQKSSKSFIVENLIARNVRGQLWLVDTRCEAGCRHQVNGDDKLAAIDTLGCNFGEGAGTEWGRKLVAIKGTRGSIRSGEETKIKRRRNEERSHDNYSMIAFEDYIFYPFVVIKPVLFSCHLRASYRIYHDRNKS